MESWLVPLKVLAMIPYFNFHFWEIPIWRDKFLFNIFLLTTPTDVLC